MTEKLFLILTLLANLSLVLLYIKAFISRKSSKVNGTTLVSLLFLPSFFIWLSLYAVRMQRCPMATVSETLVFTAFASSLIFFILDALSGRRSVGFLIVSCNLMILLLGLFLSPHMPPASAKLSGVLFPLHVSLSMLSYLMFFFVLCFSLMMSRSLADMKKGMSGIFFNRIPSIRTLEKQMDILLSAGVLFLFCGIIFGMVWLTKADFEVIGIRLKFALAVISLLIFSALLLLRILKKISLRRVTAISLIGFLSILISFLLGRHGI